MNSKEVPERSNLSLRHLIRLPDFDYSQPGAYFVTICTKDKLLIFGEITCEQMALNQFGKLAESCWLEIPFHYPGVTLDAYAIMPDHVHGIIIRSESELEIKQLGEGFKPSPTRHALPEIVRGFKTFSSRRINQERGTPGTPVWQRNYYEHVIRGESELNRVREYINNNPLRKSLDL